jgi:hypothetical protein
MAPMPIAALHRRDGNAKKDTAGQIEFARLFGYALISDGYRF